MPGPAQKAQITVCGIEKAQITDIRRIAGNFCLLDWSWCSTALACAAVVVLAPGLFARTGLPAILGDATGASCTPS